MGEGVEMNAPRQGMAGRGEGWGDRADAGFGDSVRVGIRGKQSGGYN